MITKYIIPLNTVGFAYDFGGLILDTTLIKENLSQITQITQIFGGR